MKVFMPVVGTRTGAEVFSSNLAEGLRRRGVDVSLHWLPRSTEWLPATVPPVPPRDAHIIHFNCDYGFVYPHGVPVVATLLHWVHGADYRAQRGILAALHHRLVLRRRQERSLRAADAVTTISAYSAAQVRLALPGIEPRVILPGIDTGFFTPGPGRRPDGRTRLLFVGSPSARKGFDLLPAIAGALGADFEVRYVAGPEFPGVANLVRQGVANREELRTAYRECDALLFPTRYEGFGLVAAEAMACGRPVIASRCTSLPELVGEGVTGILCPVDDVGAFAAAARSLAADPAQAAAMGVAGRARAAERFGLARMAAQYGELYESLMSGQERIQKGA